MTPVPVRYIVAGSLIDGGGGDVRRYVYLAVKEGLITAIGPASDLPRSDGSAVDDLTHCTFLPALVDCSVSLLRSPSVDSRVRSSVEEAGHEYRAAMLAQHIRYCHAHGVLGVAASDDMTNLVDRYQKEMALASSIDIRTSGSPGGDFLRLWYTSNIEDREGSHSGIGPENLRRMLQHRGGKMAVVVANGRQQVAEALAAGCDAIEQGYGMGEDNLRIMAARDVLWIPSVLRARNALDGAAGGGDIGCRFSTRYVAPGKADPGTEAFWKRMLAGQLAQLRLARKLGVRTAVGTGSGSIGILHGESMVEEMKLFIRAGYPLPETIRCASEYGARFFGMKRLGALTVGKCATFLVTRGTVQQLPRKLSYLEGIYVDGAPSSGYRKNPA